MRRRLVIVLAAVPAAAVLTLAGLEILNGKIALVRNAGTEKIGISLTVSSGNAVERSESRSVAAGGMGWIAFFPRSRGLLLLRCESGRHRAIVSLGGGGLGGASISSLRLNGCQGVLSRRGLTL
jgi:hypothetical protein